jgi:hypothetical protein
VETLNFVHQPYFLRRLLIGEKTRPDTNDARYFRVDALRL